MSLCQYKDIFGKPGEGAHSYRVANVAVVDVGGKPPCISVTPGRTLYTASPCAS